MNARTMLDSAIAAAEARIAEKQAQLADLAADVAADQENLTDLRTARDTLGPAAAIEQEVAE